MFTFRKTHQKLFIKNFVCVLETRKNYSNLFLCVSVVWMCLLLGIFCFLYFCLKNFKLQGQIWQNLKGQIL